MTRARDVANLIGSGNYSSTTFTATAGQTAFTIAHTQGFVQVFMNGLLLDETADYTSNGTAITLTSGAAAGDEIEVVKYNTFSVGDAIPASGGTFTGSIDASAGLTTPAGHVVDYQRRNFDLNNFGSTTSSSMVNIAGVYVDITPKSSTNLLVFKVDIMARVNTSGNYGRFDIYDTNASAKWNTNSYVQSSNYYANTLEWETIHISHTNTAGTTNTMRLQLRTLIGGGGSATLFLDWSSLDNRTVEVWEIAQ